jgi:uncharacterized membrane protein
MGRWSDRTGANLWVVITLRAEAASEGSAQPGVRYGRESLEHARLVNLSDAVFAIAMTLLAFKVGAAQGADTFTSLVPVVPQVLAFLLSFGIVANFWWHHHGLFARIDQVEPGFIFVNLALLGAVALVPFPTELIGQEPGAVAPAVVYLALMVLISGLILLMVHRAEHAGLWRDELGQRERRELHHGWVAMMAVTAAALLVALLWPLVGLAMLLLTGPADHLARHRLRKREPRHAP